MAEVTHHGFTPEQVAWMDRRFGAGQPAADRSFDRPTIMWMVGGLTALGVAVSGFLYSEIGSVREELREEIGSVREEIGSVREEIGSLRDEVSSLRDQVTRIEAILNERLPRGE